MQPITKEIRTRQLGIYNQCSDAKQERMTVKPPGQSWAAADWRMGRVEFEVEG
jgi:hypothetical protein